MQTKIIVFYHLSIQLIFSQNDIEDESIDDKSSNYPPITVNHNLKSKSPIVENVATKTRNQSNFPFSISIVSFVKNVIRSDLFRLVETSVNRLKTMQPNGTIYRYTSTIIITSF